MRLSGLASGLALAVRPAGSLEAPRARVGPEDPFCGAVRVRKDLRVPLQVEGAAWTMRGVPPRCLVTFPATVQLVRGWRPSPRGGRSTGQIRRAPHAAGHRGHRARQRGAPRASARRARRKLPPRLRRAARALTPAAYGGSLWRSSSLRLAASASRDSRPGRQGWRAGGAPLKL